MPIPFLVAGLAVATGVIGAGGHISASETNEKAQRRTKEARDLYNSAKNKLELVQNKTETALLQLGNEKKYILETSMNQFLNAYDKIKHITFNEAIGINEISKFQIDEQGVIEIREMVDVYSSSIESGIAGAAAGTAVVLATGGSLIGGEIATAGAALAAGEIASLGAIMAPLAVVAAPMMLFTGISASMKADENLEKAEVMYAEAEVAAEKMKVSARLCEAISEKSYLFNDLLLKLNVMFAECSGLLAGVVKKKEGLIFKKKLKSKDFSEDEIELIAVTRALAGAIKSAIDTPMLTQDGKISNESSKMYNETFEKLPAFNEQVSEIRQINYNVKPIAVKEVKSEEEILKRKQRTKAGINTILAAALNLFAIIAGIFVATKTAGVLAQLISFKNDKYFLVDALQANKIALWFVIFAMVMHAIGNFNKSFIGRISAFLSGLGVTVLFAQFCKFMAKVDHPIIISLVLIVVFGIAVGAFEFMKMGWSGAAYFYALFSVLAVGILAFWGYAFFTGVINLPKTICLILATIFMGFLSLFLAVYSGVE